MKNGQIFAHKSTARGGLDLEYLDETSHRKVSLRERADMEQQIGKKLKDFTDYASKETLGQVHAGGFLHHSIRINPDGTSTSPSQLSNPERKQRINEAWREHLAKFPSTAKRPVIAHRLVFSMSEEQHDALTDAGINPDQVLHSSLKKVMRRFNERFYPNDSIGYAYGLHHDTANLHTHVAICPRTENGSYVGCSTSRSRQSRHKKQMDCIKSWFEIENSRWEKILSSPQKLEETLPKRLDADKLVFSQKLNHLQTTALQCVQNSDSIRLQQLCQWIRNLEVSRNVCPFVFDHGFAEFDWLLLDFEHSPNGVLTLIARFRQTCLELLWRGRSSLHFSALERRLLNYVCLEICSRITSAGSRRSLTSAT